MFIIRVFRKSTCTSWLNLQSFVFITGYYGRLSLLTRSQLTDLSLNSPKPQQSVRQWRPFANHNKANAFNVLAMNLSKLIIYHHYPWIRVDLFSSQKRIEKVDFIWNILTDFGNNNKKIITRNYRQI